MTSSISKIVLVCLVPLTIAADPAADARIVVDKAIQAHGGEARLARTKTGRLKANVVRTTVGVEVFKARWEEIFDLPDRYRRVIEGIENGSGVRMELVVNGKIGWMRRDGGVLTDFPVPEPLPVEQHWHAMLAQLLLLRSKNARLTLLGDERRDGRSLVGVRVVSPDTEAVLHFDKITGLLARARRPLANFMPGREGVGETSYEDYRDINGIRYPMRINNSNGDADTIHIALSSIDFLDKIDQSVFAKPAVAVEDPAGGRAQGEASDRTDASDTPSVDSSARWDVRLIAATLGMGIFVAGVWLFVRVSKRRRQETHPQ
jgi:hypothetical protein